MFYDIHTNFGYTLFKLKNGKNVVISSLMLPPSTIDLPTITINRYRYLPTVNPTKTFAQKREIITNINNIKIQDYKHKFKDLSKEELHYKLKTIDKMSPEAVKAINELLSE